MRGLVDHASRGRARARPIDPARFADLLPAFADRDYQHSLPYLEAITAHNRERLELVAIDDGHELIGLAAVRLRMVPLLGAVAITAGGPLVAVADLPIALLAANHRAAVDALARRCAEQNVRLHLRTPVLPYLEDWFEGLESPLHFPPSPLFTPYQTMVVDTSPTEDELRGRLSPQWRRHLREAERAQLEVDEPDIGETWARMMPIHHEMVDRKQIGVSLPPSFWSDLFAREAADRHFRGVIVHAGGRDLAGVITGGDAVVATYLIGASAAAALPVRAGYLATWAAIRLSRRLGQRFYDLGGIDKAANPGGWQFKHGLRGRELTTPQPVVVTPRNVKGQLIEWTERAVFRLRRRR